MFSIQPGQGLGYTASKLIALGLGSDDEDEEILGEPHVLIIRQIVGDSVRIVVRSP